MVGTAATADAFDVAVRALGQTHPVPVQAPAASAPAAVPSRATRRAAQRKPRQRFTARRAAAASVSIGAVVAVGLLAVGMTLPAGVVAAPAAASALSVDATAAATGGGDAGIQAYVASGGSAPASRATLNRVVGFAAATTVTPTAPAASTAPSAPSAPSTTTVSGATGESDQQAGTTGILNFSNAVFTNNRACPVQWPFAVGVPISWGFGPRPGEFHEGVDFTPGAGAHIQAIAAGTVVVAQPSYYGYGGAVMIDHVIDGQKVASLYGHLETGSIQVHVGEQVQVGQYIGNTGATGYAFGANTHFEIRENDTTPINPIPWLKAHNQC